MGLTYTDLTLENTFGHRQLRTQALVDSGAVFMVR